MPKKKNPRRGSMQFWPRKRAADIVARVRAWPKSQDAKPLGFAGYKVGMTHIIAKDTKPTSITKGEEVSVPVTIVECPPLKVMAVLLYTRDSYGLHCAGQITAEKLDKELSRKIPLPKKKCEEPKVDVEKLADVRLLVHTQPKLTSLGKKKPEVFELGLGGSVEDKLAKAKELLGKEIAISDVFEEGQVVDCVSITKGKGYQGPVKRFGVKIRFHKSEKTKRGPGSLGPWSGPTTYRVAHAGQMGYHQRRELNKQILKIGSDASQVTPKGGFLRYGPLKNTYLLVKGSLNGPSKRLVTFMVQDRGVKEALPEIVQVSTRSMQ